MTIHDFRMVTGNTHTNLIFDALVPYELKMSGEEVKGKIEEIVRNLEGDYFAVVHIDQGYVYLNGIHVNNCLAEQFFI